MSHDIQIDLSAILPAYRTYIENTLTFATANNINVLLSKERSVEVQEGTFGNGCFYEKDGDTPHTFLVACGQELDNWFAVFLHESCHMDQCMEQAEVWTEGRIKGFEAADIVDLWIDNIVELTPEQCHVLTTLSLAVEFDCEKRAVEKIKKYSLPVNIPNYIKTANAYVLFYKVMGLTRKWYDIGNEPYNNQTILDAMPDTFSIDFDNPPQELLDLMIIELASGDK